MTVLSATQSELERLGAVDTPEGQTVLMLATALDSGKSLMAVPAMAKELSAQLKAIRDAAPPAADPIEDLIQDEVAERRDAKSGSGGVAGTSGVVRTTQRGKRVGR